ncbi:MAG: hypothetical protein AAGF57_09345, partial [Pseudomonadota bacterium]
MVLSNIRRVVRLKEEAPAGLWEHVSIDVPDALDLIEQQNQGYMKVTLQNNSNQAIEPGANLRIAFAYRVLDGK